MCLTDECYEHSCKDTKTCVFLVSVFVVVLALLAYAIYLVAKPVECIKDKTKLRTLESENQMYRKYYKKQPKCSETSILKYPQIVAIVEKDTKEHICSGAIISRNWVLTAAHCLALCQERTCRDFVVRAGSSHTNRGGQVHTIIGYAADPKFNSTTLENDLGLIQVDGFHINNRTIKVAAVSATPVGSGEDMELLGWAPYSKVDVIYRDNALKKISLTVESHAVCRNRMKGEHGRFRLADYMLCGTYASKGGGCYTDAGGPVLFRGAVAGIAMFGQICFSCDYHMSILTDVSRFQGFIRNFTGL